MENKIIKGILTLLVTFSCMILLTGCTSKTEEEKLPENEVKEIVENIAGIDPTTTNIYGFKSEVNDEKITVNLEESPRPESFKMALAVEKSLLDEGYVIKTIVIGGYASAMNTEFDLSDGSIATLSFNGNDKLASIIIHSETDQTLIPIARTIVETKELNIPKEESDLMYNTEERVDTGTWSGSITESPKGLGRMFSYSKHLKDL
ncbi:MAG: hypothetical protein IJ880_15515 [Bacilli bacterium]|nr:hypothetical protein [Bacilli bacterium]